MRDTAIRTALLARIQPLVDRLARDLAALAERRIEAEIGRVGEVFELALSAYQSLDQYEISVSEPSPGKLRVRVRDVKPANVDHEEPVERPRVVPASEPPDGQSADTRATSNGKKWPSCRICGRVGVTARTHPAHCDEGGPADLDADAGRDTKPSNATKLDRFARIEAAAAARRAGTGGL